MTKKEQPSRSASKEPEETKTKTDEEERVTKKSKFLMATAVSAAMKPKILSSD